MKKLIMVAAIAAAICAQAETKVGTVDMLKLVRNHASYDSNRTLLTDTQKDYSKKLEKIKTELEELQKDGQKKADQYRNPMMAQAAKDKLEKELTEIQQKLMQGQQRLRNEAMRSEEEMQKLETRLLKAASDDIRKKLADFAKQAGYTIILDASACPYADKSTDVTDAMLKVMGVDPTKAREATDEGK